MMTSKDDSENEKCKFSDDVRSDCSYICSEEPEENVYEGPDVIPPSRDLGASHKCRKRGYISTGRDASSFRYRDVNRR
jgi:hypothetical protein